jgi:hypothetical protein
MNSDAMRCVSPFLLGFACLGAWGQQAAQSGAAESASQVITNQDKSSEPQKTSDGVAACPAEFKLPNGVYRIAGGILPPVATKAPQAAFPNESRKYARKFMKDQHLKRFEARSVLGLTVDTMGIPHDVCVLNEAGHGFDRRATETVSEYRFKPATLDGKPVSVRLAVEVKFALW